MATETIPPDVRNIVRTAMSAYGNAQSDGLGRQWDIYAAMNFAEQAIMADRAARPAIDAETVETAETWQDISTAPHDGTHVLVMFEGTMSPPTVAHWFGPAPLPGLRSGAWYLSVQQFEGPAIHPTHWRTLPASQGDDTAGRKG